MPKKEINYFKWEKDEAVYKRSEKINWVFDLLETLTTSSGSCNIVRATYSVEKK